ncbi:hypothetical protein HWV07_11195 [Natronomonas salina]|uniref:hypothetical protein n=1 Tax=Natronomonas salina TaxID=1710540 RepID=UPI0015B4AB98|nr:hypothetical protein [Natronomonas salina]QLD89566.1 hypothetical protein HWV07_11195 [Natronomonas salina]
MPGKILVPDDVKTILLSGRAGDGNYGARKREADDGYRELGIQCDRYDPHRPSMAVPSG